MWLNEIKELYTNHEKYFIIAGVLLVACIISYNVFGGSAVPNDGTGVNAVRTNLQSVGEEQQSALDGVKSVETGLDASTAEAGRISAGLGDTAKSVKTVEERIDASEDKLRTSSELIAEGKSILAGIRERGQSGN